MPELVGASHSVNGEVGQLNILGGDFTYNVVSTNESEPYVLNISGGTFSADPTAYLADNTIVKRNGSAEPYTYTVLAKANLTSGVYLSDPTGALANRYYVSNADTENCVWTVSYSAPSSSGGSSSSGSATTEKNPDGSTTTTVTKPDGSKTETTTSQPVTDESGTTTTTKTETVTNKDGSKTETTTETVKGADGATTETKTQVATDKTGATTSTETVKATDANGSTATKVTETNAAGETTTNVQTTVSDKAVAEAAKDEAPVTLPVEVTAPKAGDTKEAAPVVQVDLPASVTPENPAKVQIPVADITPGTVAVIVNADGTEEIVKDSVVDENGVILNLEGSATVKLVDNSKDFDDTKNHWAQDSIDFVTAREIFNGTSDTTFSPNSDMTRGMLMTVLARFDGQDTSGGTVWYEKGMEWAKANGISDGTNPNEPVTREQLATMLYRYAGSPAAEGSFDAFPDGGNVNDYADAAMRWAVETGLINGMGDGTLNPQGDAARAQLAAILMRFCENLVK
ncbi:MAG: S-layer homology domain-containing protein [Bacillota bacterium]|nr:S-layer homology domain-containing protein [Bacillota bacterium]